MKHIRTPFLKKLIAVSLTALSLSVVALSFSASAELTPDLTTVDYTEPDVKVSPNGKYLALALVNQGRRTISVLKTKDLKPVGGINFGDWQDAGNFFWVTDKRLVTEILHRHEWDNTPKFFGELYAANFNGKNREMIYGFRAGEQQTGSSVKRREDIYGWAKIVNTLPDDEKHILVSSTLIPDGSAILNGTLRLDEVNVQDIKKLYSTVHRLNVKTGKIYSQITRSPVANAKFFTTPEGELRYVTGLDSNGNHALHRYSDGEWNKVALPSGSEAVGFDDNYQNAYYVAQNDTSKCLSKFDLSANATVELDGMCYEQDPFLAISTDNANVYGVKGSAAEQYSILSSDSAEATFMASVQALFEGQDIDITSSSEGGEYYVVKARDAQNTLTFYLYSAETNQFSRLI